MSNFKTETEYLFTLSDYVIPMIGIIFFFIFVFVVVKSIELQ
jgi:hypothetical protein